MGVKVKICGLKDAQAVRSAVSSGADYIGFIFYPLSPRHVSAEQAHDLAKMSGKAKTVAVFVNPTLDDIEHMQKNFKPDYIQLHGDETPDFVRDVHERFALPVIKALTIRNSDDVAKALPFNDIADMLLFDTKAPAGGLPGGNGKTFDWTLLKNREFDIPWFVAGGINSSNVKDALRITDAPMVDVSSSLESEPGVKDLALVDEFIKKVKAL